MDEVDLKKLERRIDELISIVERLRVENRLLREQNDVLRLERTRLIEKTELARNRVEAMISRLKAMEPQA